MVPTNELSSLDLHPEREKVNLVTSGKGNQITCGERNEVLIGRVKGNCYSRETKKKPSLTKKKLHSSWLWTEKQTQFCRHGLKQEEEKRKKKEKGKKERGKKEKKL